MRRADEERSGDDSKLLSRRDMLIKTYGVGATLIFGQRLTSVVTAATNDTATPAENARSEPQPQRTQSGEADVQRLPGGGQPRSVCAGHAGVLVVGATEAGEPISWHRRSAVGWEECHLSQPAPGAPEVWGVAARRDRYVAVGSTLQQESRPIARDSGVPGEDAQRTFTARRRMPTVWWTRDCITWSGQTLGGVPDTHAQLIAVASDDELVVAAGSVLDADGVQGAAGLMLASNDGERWEPAAIARRDEVFAEGSFTGITATGDSWFATSTNMDGGIVWTSVDGRHWAPIPSSMDTFRGITLQGVGVRRRRVLIAGTALTDLEPRYYSSGDGGHSWDLVRLDLRMLTGANAAVSDLAVWSDKVVVVGTSNGAPVFEGGAVGGSN